METPQNRIAPRSRVLKDGKIVTGALQSVIDCCVRDISATGARLKCLHAASVPNEFKLMLPGENTIRGARVDWRKEELLGIAFTSDPRPAPPRKW